MTSKEDMKGLRYTPFCFTEQGVTMLSCALNSDRAIAVNIQIIRIFTSMREMLLTHKDLLLKVVELEKKFGKHDEKLVLIFDYLKQLINIKENHSSPIGYYNQSQRVSGELDFGYKGIILLREMINSSMELQLAERSLVIIFHWRLESPSMHIISTPASWSTA